MKIEMERRGFITGIGALFAAPAIVRASSLMPVKVIPDFVEPGLRVALQVFDPVLGWVDRHVVDFRDNWRRPDGFGGERPPTVIEALSDAARLNPPRLAPATDPANIFEQTRKAERRRFVATPKALNQWRAEMFERGPFVFAFADERGVPQFSHMDIPLLQAFVETGELPEPVETI